MLCVSGKTTMEKASGVWVGVRDGLGVGVTLAVWVSVAVCVTVDVNVAVQETHPVWVGEKTGALATG
jgi:hypothetical protein